MKNSVKKILGLTLLLTTLKLSTQQNYALDYTEYIRKEQRALVVFEGALQEKEFERNLKITIKENGRPFSDYKIKSIKLLPSGNTLEIQFEFKKDIKDGVIEIAILDSTLFTRKNNAVFPTTLISIPDVYELIESNFESEKNWGAIETFTKVVYIIAFVLFIFGFYDEFLAIILVYQRYFYLLLINHKMPPLFQYFLNKLRVPFLYESDLFVVNESEIKCQNQKKFNRYSCAFFNNHSGFAYRFAILILIKIIIKSIDYFLLQKRLKKAKKQIEEARLKSSSDLVRNLAFQRSATIAMKEYIKEQKKTRGTNCIAVVNHYLSHNFFFYIIRYHTLPIFMSLWICMYRYRENSTPMKYNFIASILFVWIFIIYTAYVLYQYMNYFPKVKKGKEPLIYRLSVAKDNTFKRKDVIISFIFDMIRALVFVFFTHLPNFVIPIFVIMGLIEIGIVIKKKRTNILYRSWKGISRTWFCINLGVLYYYHLKDFYSNEMASFLIASVTIQLVLTVLISLTLGLLGLIGYIKYFHKTIKDPESGERKRLTNGQINKVAALSVGIENERRREARFSMVEESQRKIEVNEA